MKRWIVLAVVLAACGSGDTGTAPTTAPDPPRVVVVVGDSIVNGVNLDHPIQERWTSLLEADGYRVVNAGVGTSGSLLTPARGLPTISERFAADVLAVPGVTDVIIAAGVNDLGHVDPALIGLALFELWNRADAAGLRVWVGTILPNRAQAETDQVNEWVRGKLAGAVCDFAADFDPANLMADGLHPNAAGNRQLADTAAGCLS